MKRRKFLQIMGGAGVGALAGAQMSATTPGAAGERLALYQDAERVAARSSSTITTRRAVAGDLWIDRGGRVFVHNGRDWLRFEA